MTSIHLWNLRMAWVSESVMTAALRRIILREDMVLYRFYIIEYGKERAVQAAKA